MAEGKGEVTAGTPGNIPMRHPTKALCRVPTQRVLFQKKTNPSVNRMKQILRSEIKIDPKTQKNFLNLELEVQQSGQL